MKTIYIVKKSIMILFASFIVACGAETLAAIIFLPAFAATWPVVGDTEHFMDLQPEGQNLNVESGVFEGEELHDTDANKRGVLSGSFNGLNIEFTVQRPGGPFQFTGRMTPVSDTDHTITRIVLTSSEGDLVLGVE